jgi:2-haloacid dehalogenase
MSLQAVVFDLYGTLLQIEGLRRPVAAAGAPDPAAFVAAWRRKQLEYAFVSSLAQVYRDFDALTALALAHICAQTGLALDAPGRAALAAELDRLPAYDDVVPALTALRAQGVPLAVLTNGTRRSAEAALAAAAVRPLLDDVLSVDAVRAYKPDPRVYALATARFGCVPREVVFVSSNGWDAAGAAAFGFRVAWCNRAGLAAETLTPGPETTIADLRQLEAFVSVPR